MVKFDSWQQRMCVLMVGLASGPNCLPSNKVISRVSYPHGLSFLINNLRYLFENKI